MVLATGSQLIDDVRRAPDDVLSSSEPGKEVSCASIKNDELILMWIIQLIQAEYTLGILNDQDRHLTDIIRSQLTRNIANTFKEVHEELIMAMDDLIPTREDGTWRFPRQRGYVSHNRKSGSRSPF